ncbi:MAG TPA: 3-isopropylmalate dehydrogenase [Gemmatimonadales bacterium]|nr:3-isopropylmalate dehydrogenase [Gemmatimonadales bacterium]
MKRFTVAVLPGDGIGPEVTAEAVRVLTAVADLYGYGILTPEFAIGAAGVAQSGEALPAPTRDAVVAADAVLLGAVGDPSLANATGKRSPEAGLLALRKLLGAYANLRPVSVHPALRHTSPLRSELLNGVDLLIVRELTGGLYYGEPRSRDDRSAINTLSYTVEEIERVARVAFDAARGRRASVTSVDKANVLEVSQLWRDTVTRIGSEYPDIRLEHLYVDYAAMRLVSQPASIDVLLTENLFGDILSDEAAVLTGSLGLLPSASIGDGPGLFEPVHGSAPALAGRGVANPIGAIASAAMLLRYALGLPEAAGLVEQGIAAVLGAGARTADIALPGVSTLTTREMGEEIARQVAESLAAPSPPRPAALDRAPPASSANHPRPLPLRSASGAQPSSAVRPTQHVGKDGWGGAEDTGMGSTAGSQGKG